ncbi:MAG: lasso peptide biosynthesis B2 protein [Legionellaceae bacterium]|nr:lasso peptide biosynthesis B2 protein [Legionellaceae bacterium]
MRTIQKIAFFYRMPFKQKGLFILNVCLCGIARACILLFPLNRLSIYFGTLNKNIISSTIISKKERYYAIQLQRSIRLAARYTPWNSNCLTQAMVAKFWCNRLHISYILYIGFAKDAEKPSGYAAHAWLTAGPIAITGGNSFSSFRVISSYVPNTILSQGINA